MWIYLFNYLFVYLLVIYWWLRVMLGLGTYKERKYFCSRSICLWLSLSVRLAVCLSVCVSVCVSIFHLFLCFCNTRQST